MNALQEARRQTGINFADILYFDGEHLCRSLPQFSGMLSNHLNFVTVAGIVPLQCETYGAPHAPHAAERC